MKESPAASITAAEIVSRCRDLGFALAGVCRAEPTDYQRELLEWLGAGKHGEMEYLRRNVALRIDPCAMVNGAKSIIVVADRYAMETSKGRNVETSKCNGTAVKQPGDDSAEPMGSARSVGRIARYARGDDYHAVIRKRLAQLCKNFSNQFPNETFRACVDTAPVLEREHAQRAGLGAVGKNTLLIERGLGSYLLLGEIITTLDLEPSAPSEPDPCGTCTRCIDACPTNAITPWSVDATRCISYLTIEHRGAIDERFHKAMGDWIFGCDICQEVCPHNQLTARSRERQDAVLPAYSPRREGLDLLEVLNWDEQAKRQAFLKSSMKRAKLDMMKRNALIAAGNALRRARGRRNTDDERLLSRIRELVADEQESALIRQTALTVWHRIEAIDR